MSDRILDKKRANFAKIRIGCCIELLIILDSFFNDFSSLDSFIVEHAEFLNNQDEEVLKCQFDSLKDLLTSNIDILLNDIDSSEEYCNYMNRYY